MPKEKKQSKNNNFYILKEKIRETDDVMTLKFLPVKGRIFSFIPGQFINVYFLDDRCGGQGKPYSLSSIPSDNFLNITVKKIGRFSDALYDLKIGEKVKISFPQGYFYPEDGMKDIVFLAGGIGITPFYSIIKNNFNNKIDKNIFLFYSNKTRNGAAFLDNLNYLAENWPKLKIVNIFTRENNKFSRCGIKMLKKYLKNLSNKYYFICGSIEFVDCLWEELKSNKVKEDNIRVESFY